MQNASSIDRKLLRQAEKKKRKWKTRGSLSEWRLPMPQSQLFKQRKALQASSWWKNMFSLDFQKRLWREFSERWWETRSVFIELSLDESLTKEHLSHWVLYPEFAETPCTHTSYAHSRSNWEIRSIFERSRATVTTDWFVHSQLSLIAGRERRSWCFSKRAKKTKQKKH